MGSLDGSTSAQIAVLRLTRRRRDPRGQGRGVDRDGLLGDARRHDRRDVPDVRRRARPVRGRDADGSAGPRSGPRRYHVVAMFFPPYSQDHSDGVSNAVLTTSASSTTTDGSGISLSASFPARPAGGHSVGREGGQSRRRSGLASPRRPRRPRPSGSPSSTPLAPDERLDERRRRAPRRELLRGVLVQDLRSHRHARNRRHAHGGLRSGRRPESDLGRCLVTTGSRVRSAACPSCPRRTPPAIPRPTPSNAATFGGHPIPGSDLVFTQFSSYRASDVAALTWTLDNEPGSDQLHVDDGLGVRPRCRRRRRSESA